LLLRVETGRADAERSHQPGKPLDRLFDQAGLTIAERMLGEDGTQQRGDIAR